MAILVKNIKQLVQAEPKSIKFRAGKEMQNLPLIDNAYLLTEGDKIKEFGKMAGIMIPGIIAGHFIGPYLESNQQLLYKLLGSVVVFFALFNLYKFIRKQKLRKPILPVSVLVIALAGLVHGMFVCGGPLLIVYASEALQDKEEFRATVSAVWIVLNGIMLARDINSGVFKGGNTLSLMWISLAVLVLALFIGNLIEHKMNKRAFMLVSYILMIISGVSLLVK